MGKMMFAVALVAASFAGGVFVNGPGLQWAKSCVETRLGHALWGNDDDEKPVEASNPPLIKEPTVVAGESERVGASRVPDTSKASVLPNTDSRRSKNRVQPAGGRADGLSAGGDLKAIAPPDVLEPAPLEPLNPPPRLQTSRGADRGVAPAKSREAGTGDPAVVTAALPKTQEAPTASKISSLPTSASPADSGSAHDPAAGWSLLRTRMKKLGVTRYGVEGTPDGQARFHCVVPIAGDGAVAQHFEAEADDAWRAADITLKRIALWRAAESATR
ncbi:MAG: hypothetical protein KGM43_13515 [Planctomycetota bacterium]|nr:hypothetical protein [Planctomycetota bacterium]